MTYRILGVALAAAFAVTMLSSAGEAGGGGWIANGTTLTGVEGKQDSGPTSLTIIEVLLPGAI